MKKILAVMLSGIMFVSLMSGCDQGKNTGDTDGTTKATDVVADTTVEDTVEESVVETTEATEVDTEESTEDTDESVEESSDVVGEDSESSDEASEDSESSDEASEESESSDEAKENVEGDATESEDESAVSDESTDPSDSAESSVDESGSEDSAIEETEGTSVSGINIGDLTSKLDIKKENGKVIITMPKEIAGEANISDEEVQKAIDNDEMEELIKNPDGGISIVLSEAQHQKILTGIMDEVDKTIKESIGSESTPNITKIEKNDKLTEFTITTKSTEPDMNEQMLNFSFTMFGTIYGIYNGEKVDQVRIRYINEATGDVIYDSAEESTAAQPAS